MSPAPPSSSTSPLSIRRRCFPSTPRTSLCLGPTPSRWASRTSTSPVVYTPRWDRKLKAGPQSVVLSFDRYDTTTYSAEIIANVDNCRLFNN
jgi:hypothetical protein